MAKILLIDDDPDILKLGKQVLSHEHHDVTLAKDARAAFDYLRTFQFDLVISDANMPDITGFELVRSIRANEQFKHLSVALLTGRRDRKDIETAIGLGVDDYILKPIDPLLFSRKVESLLKKNKQELPSPPKEEEIKGARVNAVGSVQFLLQIQVVSEFGLEAIGNYQLPIGATFEIKTPIFDEIGIKPLLGKVTSAEATGEVWNFQIQFVGANENSLQRIRAWVNTKLIRQHTKVA